MTIKPWTERFPEPTPKGVKRQLMQFQFMQQEIDELRAELEVIKQQKPIAVLQETGGMIIEAVFYDGVVIKEGDELYLLSGAKP